MIISVINLKGGSGKTTVATNLVYALSQQGKGKKMLLIDTDMQRSASRWFDTREAKDDKFSVVSILEDKSLKKQIPEFKTQFEHIVIDGAPQIDLINVINIFVADLIIIPITPSPYDLWATQSILDKIKSAQELAPEKQAYFLLNRVNEQTALSKQAEEVLQAFELPVFKTKLRNRIVYADSAVRGMTVFETSNSKAREELTSFFQEVKKIIGGRK